MKHNLHGTYEESGASWAFIPDDLWESGYHEEAQAMKRELANSPLTEAKDLVQRAPHKEGSGKIRDMSGKEHKIKWYCEPAAGGVVKFAAAYGIKLACDGVYSVASSSARGQLVWRSPERAEGSLHNRFTFRLMKKMVDGFFTTSCTTVFNAYIFTSGLGCGDKKQLAGTSKVSVRSVGPRSKKDGDEVMLYELSVHK
ncbi:uncharacterized protein E0L32_007999 [Thyridium curvatum]|uniref:Uncharacterized protein n=1 Tax=Thyridium curvatum TaxID=1093900 RepID=A0A507B2K7_9PEZI|nr:uncharacterized protein E0L32_007999 [Thyridium curvatum]TPX11138.1 hypothetical protein E0L32_007999 [Thyridium curvatum]